MGQVAETVRDVAEVMRFGGCGPDEESWPFTVLAEQVNYRLRRYFPERAPASGRPILPIPPLMMSAEMWDVSRATSAVTALNREGIDPPWGDRLRSACQAIPYHDSFHEVRTMSQ